MACWQLHCTLGTGGAIDKVEVQAASKKAMDVLTTWEKAIAATDGVEQPEATVTRLKRVLH